MCIDTVNRIDDLYFNLTSDYANIFFYEKSTDRYNIAAIIYSKIDKKYKDKITFYLYEDEEDYTSNQEYEEIIKTKDVGFLTMDILLYPETYDDNIIEDNNTYSLSLLISNDKISVFMNYCYSEIFTVIDTEIDLDVISKYIELHTEICIQHTKLTSTNNYYV